MAASFDAGSPELAEKVRTIIVSAVIVFELSARLWPKSL